MAVDPKLLELLVCPRHKTALSETGSELRCNAGHQFPVVNGVPVLLDAGPQTLWVAGTSVVEAQRHCGGFGADPYFLNTIGISDDERTELKARLRNPEEGVDPVAAFLVGATNGIAYNHLRGRLQEYPIPELRLPVGDGKILVDVGCNWGRWCIAAARRGYTPIGIDPSLGAVLAAQRIAAKLGVTAHFVVGDARFLPFRTDAVDVVYSYSVIQHFSRSDAATAIQEMSRVLRLNGRSLVQMPTTFGLRCLYHQARRRFREATDFDVRYWSVPTLRRLFTESVGQTSFSVDCFFGIGLQASDEKFMTPRLRVVIRASELLRSLSHSLRWLCYVADSVYVESVRRAEPAQSGNGGMHVGAGRRHVGAAG